MNKGGATAIDLFITQASLMANTLDVVGLGFSANGPFFIITMCVYTSGTGLADSLTAYGTHTLPAGEMVAEFYVQTGLISTVAVLVGAPFWSMAFVFVVHSEWIPMGSLFWLCSGLFGAGCAGVAALKRRWLLPSHYAIRSVNGAGSDNSLKANEAPASAQASQVATAGQIIKGTPNGGIVACGVTIASGAPITAT